MVVRVFVKVRVSREACETFYSFSIFIECILEFVGIDLKKIKFVFDMLNEWGIVVLMCDDLELVVW